MLEDNLMKQLYYFRSENYKGYSNDSSLEDLLILLDELENKEVKTKVSNYVFNQEDQFTKQYCIDTEYFYGIGLKDGMNMVLEILRPQI